MNQPSQHPLEALWQAQRRVGVVLAGECIALVLALAPGGDGNRWVYFGLASFLIQWIALLTLGALYLPRRFVERLRPLHVAWLALGLLLVSTWLVGGVAWLLIGAAWPSSPEGWLNLMLRLTGIDIVVGFLALDAFQNPRRAPTRQTELKG